MKFVTISDVHIKEPGDQAETNFLKFLESDEVKDAKYIFLLGDIFDLLVGPGYKTEDRYEAVFKAIKSKIVAGKKIIQFEGNHDFHFKKFIDKLKVKWNVDGDAWEYKSEPSVYIFNEKRILFCHGDEIEVENPSYQTYRKWIRSFFIKFLANYIVPGRLVQAIGDNASKKSRERNNSRYSEDIVDKEVRPRFRKAALLASKKYNADTVICGHSHCKDDYDDEVRYLNNGYFPITKSYIYFDGKQLIIKSLPAD